MGGTKSILTYPAAEIIKLFEIICNNVFNDSPPNGRPNLKKRGKLLEVTLKNLKKQDVKHFSMCIKNTPNHSKLYFTLLETSEKYLLHFLLLIID